MNRKELNGRGGLSPALEFVLVPVIRVEVLPNYICSSVSVGDWSWDPHGYQNLWMLKSLI